MSKQAILCVDDENIILQSIKTELINLYDHEFLIETAESGPEALELFGELLDSHYDIPVIISDYIMPGMKGDELLKQIHRISPQSLTVMLTGQAKLEGITNAINNANLFRYLEKPWKRDELKAIINMALEAYRRNKILTGEYHSLLGTMDDLTAEIQGTIVKLTELKGTPDGAEQLEAPKQAVGERGSIEEIILSLNKLKTNMDSLAVLPNFNNSNSSLHAIETEEQCYRANQEELARITALINDLKAGCHE